MKFLIIDENSKWLSDVQKLGDDSRRTLGFMTTQAFADYARHRQILGLIIITSAGKDRKAKGGEKSWKRQMDDAVTCA